MASIPDSAWITSFFYKQDLRSLYMNNLLNASFQPGVYNADIGIFSRTENEADRENGESPGLNILIKKGTTLIFSNSYKTVKKDSKDCIERDLDSPGDYLIKCYANKDVRVNLAVAGVSSSLGIEKILGSGASNTKAPKELFVIAYMAYNKDEDAGLTYRTPQFSLIVKNTDYNGGGDAYFSWPSLSDTSVYIPDGLEDNSTNKSVKNLFSYLILGVAVDKASSQTYLTNTSWAENGSTNWMRNHYFTSRGLPEYRYNFIANKAIQSPELIPVATDDSTINTLALDLPYSSINNNIINKPLDWKKLYSIGSYRVLKSEESSREITLPSLSLDSESGNFPKDLQNFAIESETNALIVDFIYISNLDKDSSADEITNNPNLKNILKNESSDTFELKSYRWATARPDQYVGPNKPSLYGYVGQTSGDENLLIIPLDASSINRDRLLNIISNRKVLPALINQMRYEGKLDPTKETSIVPVALIFREVKYENGKWKFLRFNTDSSYENISAADAINPANILNFFDLQFKTSKINTISLNTDDVFSIIPALE